MTRLLAAAFIAAFLMAGYTMGALAVRDAPRCVTPDEFIVSLKAGLDKAHRIRTERFGREQPRRGSVIRFSSQAWKVLRHRLQEIIGVLVPPADAAIAFDIGSQGLGTIDFLLFRNGCHFGQISVARQIYDVMMAGERI